MLLTGARAAAVAALLLLAWSANATEPVYRIDIQVEPYYAAARHGGEHPRVAVGKQYNDLLSSNRRQDIVAARDLIVAKPRVVTPITMMVLAIRLYDVGLRDDAVFWFYVAKDRYIVLSEVLDVRAPGLAQVADAMRNFSTLAGPVINGYAFCDLAKQKDLHAKAVAWVESNPYPVMFMAQLPGLPGERGDNYKRAIAAARERVAKERAYFDDAKTVEDYYATRKRNQADVKFCWQ
jgi:hypothetical protein